MQSDQSDDSESSDDVILLSAQKKKQKATGEKHETHGSRSDSVDSLSRAVDRVTVSDSSVPQASSSVSGVNQSVGDMGSVSSAGLEKKRKSPKIGGHKIRGSIYERLYSYQIEGLEFMLRLFDAEAKGCILADDMGLGKTIQTIVLLSTLMDENAIKSALIVAPTTLLVNWGKEFQKWYPDIDIYSYHTGTQKKRLEQLRTVQKRGGVIFTTFGLLQNHVQYMNSYRDQDFVWDFVVLDEAHKIKNATKTTRAASDLPSRFNLAITGTPVQNNLKELWTIFNWVMAGELLGGYTQFKLRYEVPITDARKKDASEWKKKNGTLLAEDLRQVYAPYFLRRTKNEVMGRRTSISGSAGLQSLPPKFDWIVWITLSEDQILMYKQFLTSIGVKAAKIERKNALTKLIDLKKICDSPFLLSRNMIREMEKLSRRRPNLDSSRLDALLDDDDDENLVSIQCLSVESLMSNTAKLVFLVQLLENLRSNGHRTLVFSQSTRMLDIIQKVLKERNFNLARLDGRVKMKDRDKIVTTFQESDSIDVCLLSTGVGSVGLTLTNADRVVIYDPSWNPGSDAQAIDRAYRIGQTKPVLVYRLITCATVEEKIFIRQVFKNSVIKQMVQSVHDPTRYFGQSDIRELLTFDDPMDCKTFRQIEEMHGNQQVPCPGGDEHLHEVRQLPHCFNVSDHDILFSVATDEIILDDNEEVQILTNVAQTRQQLNSETDGIRRDQEGKYKRAFDMRVATASYNDFQMPLDPLPNPTQIPPDLQIIEPELESDFFNESTVAIDDSDLQIIPPYKSPQRPNLREEDLIGDLSSDSDDAYAASHWPTNSPTSLSLSVLENGNHQGNCAADQLANESVPISLVTSPVSGTAESDDDVSDIVTRKPKRRLTELMSASDTDENEDLVTGMDDRTSESCSHGSGQQATGVNVTPPHSPSTDPQTFGILSDDSSASSEVIDFVLNSPADFKSLASRFHSTAVNFDVDSPVATGTPSLPHTALGHQSLRFAANEILADDSEASEDERSSPLLPFSPPAHQTVSQSRQSNLHLSDISVPAFDRTNRALRDKASFHSEQIGDLHVDSPERSCSPTIDDSGRNFYPIRRSLIKTPTPSKTHFSANCSKYSSEVSPTDVHRNSEASIHNMDSHLFDDRPDSPLVDDVADASQLMSTSAGPHGSLPVDHAVHNVTLRKSRPKSRSVVHVSGLALDLSDDQHILPEEPDSPTM